jgi:pSer/pThr/pTyr-binding forkhead associated (FHA) protein
MAEPTPPAVRLGDLTPCVRVLTGVLRGHVMPVYDRLEIGRASSSDIQLVSSGVSRTHAVIIPRGEEFVLIDMLSTNGTFVRGERVEQHVLGLGDCFRIGDCELVFELFDEPTPDVPAQHDERTRRPTYPVIVVDDHQRAPTPSRIHATAPNGEPYPGDLFADIVVYRNLRLRALRDASMPARMRSRLEQLDAALRSGPASSDSPQPFTRYSLRAPAKLEFEGDRYREVWLLELAVDGATCAGTFDDVELDALCWLSVEVGADSFHRVVFTCRVYWARPGELGLVFSGAPGSAEHETEKKATTQRLRAIKG